MINIGISFARILLPHVIFNLNKYLLFNECMRMILKVQFAIIKCV